MGSEVKIMFILAHPDDESFIPSGTIIKYAREGAKLIYLCATCGEEGKYVGKRNLLPREKLKAIRCKELEEACKILGIDQHYILDLPDGHLDELNQNKPIQKIVFHLRSHKPDVVVTFDPTGISCHLDHIAVHAWVTEAFDHACDPTYLSEIGGFYTPKKLYYLTVPSNHLISITDSDLMAKYIDGKITTVINVKDYLEEKRWAIECHKSQWMSIQHIFKFAGGMDELEDKEYYILAKCNIKDYAYEVTEDDLLSGIRTKKKSKKEERGHLESW